MMLKFFGEIHHVLKGSCFTYTLAQALGLKESELLKLLKDLPECRTRAYYSQAFVSGPRIRTGGLFYIRV